MAAPIPLYRDYEITRSDAPSWCADMLWQAFPADYGGESALFGADPDDCRAAIDWYLEWQEERRARARSFVRAQLRACPEVQAAIKTSGAAT